MLIKKFNWCSSFDPMNGYGYLSLKLLEAMNRKLTTEITPIHLMQIRHFTREHFAMAGVDLGLPIIMIHPPDVKETTYPGRLWLYTMYESTKLPKNWSERINEMCERLLVPTEFCKKLFMDSDVNIPIHVIPGGIDPYELPTIKDIPDRPYTFMTLGDRGNRKGHDLVWRAFWDEFQDEEDVRLIIKVRGGSINDSGDVDRSGSDIFNLLQEQNVLDPRVSFWREDVVDKKQMFEVADCFVFPTRGEGYGLPPREAAARGLPVICTNWGGTEGCENWALPLNYKMKQSLLNGLWAEPDLAQLRKHMRWCYENKYEAQGFGMASASWLRKNETWDIAADKLWTLMEKYFV